MDTDALLVPIREDAPCGSDLRDSPEATALTEAKEHRREDDPKVVPGGKAADWRALVRVATRGLLRESKDLDLVAYLIEGLTRTEGLPGLCQGLTVLRGLMEKYWVPLHPGAAGRGQSSVDLEVRVPAVERCGGPGVQAAVRMVPLTVGVGAMRPLTLADHEEAGRLEAAARGRPEVHKEMVAGGAVSLQKWLQGVGATPKATIAGHLANAQTALATVAAIEADGRRLAPTEAPTLRRLRDTLETLVTALAAGATPAAPDDPTNAAVPATPAVEAAPVTGPVASRQAAIQQLVDVANYLRATEPHSPAPFLIERCVRWLRMPYEELMADLVKTPDVMRSVRETLGLPPAP